MKKLITILLALVIALTLAACGAGGESDSESVWSLQQTVDEFGDVTEKSETWMTARTTGDFSNTATASSDLTVDVGLIYNLDNNQYIAQFNLLEYNDHPVTYSDNDNLVFKMKIDEKVYEYALSGTAPNGGLFLGTEAYDFSANILFDELYAGRDVRCIININNAQYNFAVESGNLQSMSDSVGLKPERTDLSLEDSLIIYLEDDISHMAAAKQFFDDHFNDFQVMNTAELHEKLTGNFFEITVDTFAPYWMIYSYANDQQEQIAFISYNATQDNSVIVRSFEDTSSSVFKPYDIAIENNVVTMGSLTKTKYYEIRKLSEDIFISYEQDEDGEFIVPSRLMVRYNDTVSSSTDVVNKMIPYIITTLLPEVAN